MWILKQCIVPAINFGPLSDPRPNKDEYQEIDTKITCLIKQVMMIDDLDVGDFAVCPREFGGLELILPGAYFDVMREAQDEKLAGKLDIFPQLRKEFLVKYGEGK